MKDLSSEQHARLRELLSRFKLPTFAAEVVRRFGDAGHHAALSTLLEVLEAGVRRARTASHRPALRRPRASCPARPRDARPLADPARRPRPSSTSSRRASSSSALRTSSASVFLAAGRPTRRAPSATPSCDEDHSVLYAPTFRVVQDLLAAKRDLALPRAAEARCVRRPHPRRHRLRPAERGRGRGPVHLDGRALRARSS